jgi:hypothetical protein
MEKLFEYSQREGIWHLNSFHLSNKSVNCEPANKLSCCSLEKELLVDDSKTGMLRNEFLCR